MHHLFISPKKIQWQFIVFLLAIVLVGINLRPALASLGPVLNKIIAATKISSVVASLLTTLPVLAMSLFAYLAAFLGKLISAKNGIALSSLIIAFACLIRSIFPNAYGLLLSAFFAGIGIASAQIWIPVIIKEKYRQNSGGPTALYATMIMGGAALAAIFTPRLAIYLGWPIALGVWGIPAFFSAIVWKIIAQFDQTEKEATRHLKNSLFSSQNPFVLIRNTKAWALTFFFGINTGSYTLILAWLPPYFISLGIGSNESGLILGILTLGEVAGGLAVSILVTYIRDRRILLFIFLAMTSIGLSLLWLAPLACPLATAIILGIGIGALFPMGLVVCMDQFQTAAQIGPLLAFVQGGGYFIASFAPLMAGFLSQSSQDLSSAWLLMAVATVLLGFLAARFGPASN